MEDSVVPQGLKACLLKKSLLGGGPPLSCLLKSFHYFLATIVCDDSDSSNICLHVCNVSFFSGHFQDFFFTSNFQKFNYYVSWHRFLWVDLVWNVLSFLNLQLCLSLAKCGKFSAIISLSTFQPLPLSPLLRF